ncbi:MAG: lyase family protein, partial [Thermoflexales bacterium]
MTTSTRLWVGRASGELDALMKRFNDSISFDVRLWDADIRGSLAYARALGRAGLLSKAEVGALSKGLKAVAAEFAAN